MCCILIGGETNAAEVVFSNKKDGLKNLRQ